MPYDIEKQKGKFKVVDKKGNVLAKGTTKKKAMAQERLLNYIHYLKSKGKNPNRYLRNS